MTLLVVINKATRIKVLLDSGASSNFIHQGMVKELGLGLRKREQPQPVNDIQGKRLGWITQYVKVTLEADNHQETMELDVIPLGTHGLVIRLPWLQKHNPTIKWGERKIAFSSPFCKKNCLRKDTSKARDEKGRFVTRKQKMQEQEFDEMAIDALIKRPLKLAEHGQCKGKENEKQQKVPSKQDRSGHKSVTVSRWHSDPHTRTQSSQGDGMASFSNRKAEGLTGRQKETSNIRNPPPCNLGLGP